MVSVAFFSYRAFPVKHTVDLVTAQVWSERRGKRSVSLAWKRSESLLTSLLTATNFKSPQSHHRSQKPVYSLEALYSDAAFRC